MNTHPPKKLKVQPSARAKVRSKPMKPLSNSEFNTLYGTSDLVDLFLLTGVRATEMTRLIDNYDGKDYVDIKTKYSGPATNRIFLTSKAQAKIKRLQPVFKNKSKRTIQRHIAFVAFQTGIRFSAHNLRATFCTRGFQMGANIIIMKNLMNHRNIKTTAHYIKYNEFEIRAALENINNLKTKYGYTLTEAVAEIHKRDAKILRLEKELERLKTYEH